MMLVEVPIKVLVPARMDTKEIGIRNLEGLKEYLEHTAMVMGMNRTTTGVLFKKDENPPTRKSVMNSSRFGLPPEKAIICSVMKSRAPLLIRPLLTMNKK